MTLPHRIRGPEGDDVNVILSAWTWGYFDWLKSHLRSADSAEAVEYDRLAKAAYLEDYRPRIGELLRRSEVLVACAVDDPWQVFGWLAWEADPVSGTLHYAYVKKPFRQQGIFRALYAAANPERRPAVVTHGGRALASMAARYRLRLATSVHG